MDRIKYLKMERERFSRYGYNKDTLEIEGYNIMERLKELNNLTNNGLLFKVRPGILQVIFLQGHNDFIYYDFYGFNTNGKYNVGTGYYAMNKINDNRIGRRKLYKSSKGYYFIQSGYRCYLDEFIKY